jgi:hypothetical protein
MRASENNTMAAPNKSRSAPAAYLTARDKRNCGVHASSIIAALLAGLTLAACDNAPVKSVQPATQEIERKPIPQSESVGDYNNTFYGYLAIHGSQPFPSGSRICRHGSHSLFAVPRASARWRAAQLSL